MRLKLTNFTGTGEDTVSGLWLIMYLKGLCTGRVTVFFGQVRSPNTCCSPGAQLTKRRASLPCLISWQAVIVPRAKAQRRKSFIKTGCSVSEEITDIRLAATGFEAPGWCRGEEDKVLLAGLLSCLCCFQLTLVTKPGIDLKYSTQALLWFHMQHEKAGTRERQAGLYASPRGFHTLRGLAAFLGGGTDNCEGNAEGGSSSSSYKVLRLTFLLSHLG